MPPTDPHLAASYFDYDLPEAAIAQVPAEPRTSARLLVDGEPIVDATVADLGRFLEPGDLLVVNDTRVLAARLRLAKSTGGAVEVLLLEPTGGDREWQALIRPSKRVKPGTELFDGDGMPAAWAGEILSGGRRLVTLQRDDLIEASGEIPLPPYIHASLADPDRYQTVYANRTGSVAAPTAGLHLSTALIDELARAGIETARVELRVGLGTFRAITTDSILDHQMHTEAYSIDPETWERIRSARRVVAVGTTVVRTLETAAATGVLDGDSSLFIRRGYRFGLVDRLLTNFHVPQSSLLVLVDAFLGGDRWKQIYGHALGGGYRFLSFGDAMLLTRRGDRFEG